MKSIHTRDTHWGMCPDADKPRGKEHAQATKDTFWIIVEKAKEMDVDCLPINGDLSHRQPLMRDLEEVDYLFSTIPSVKVILIVDNHDRVRENSALLSSIWSPNVTFIVNEDPTPVHFEDINTEVHGFNYHTTEIKAPLLEDIQVPLNNRIQVLVAHGGDAAHLLINFDSLKPSPSSYIALGHAHKHHVLTGEEIACCGSSRPLDLAEAGSHGFYAGEIYPVTGKLINLQFTPAANLQYMSLAVSVSRDTTNGELCDRISNEIEGRGSQRTYRFRVRGMKDPDIEFDLEQLSARYRIVEITDDSEPQYDFSALFAEHSGDIIGFCIQALQKENIGPVERKAPYHGVSAPLHITDERN